ncbi:hypothetical protein [Moorena sp. SIO4A5]|uniref:roadblock/LC7 domain-containing protein n=1 Tax=Moorena sp. SIO4A5 TaxID=2607838 RepID=UPI0013CD6452|nr:hypothetical protein [Moorena sp. SIO4A5]NEO23158.1 hypothetical protein [Moorena sp. SIO4A5]
MDIKKIKDTLKKFKDDTSGIQGVVIVQENAMIITETLIGNWDSDVATNIAGVMDYLPKRICNKLEWDPAPNICVRSSKYGYIMSVPCGSHKFLLVKASSSISQGLLESEIAEIIDDIKTYINGKSSSNNGETITDNEDNDDDDDQGLFGR